MQITLAANTGVTLFGVANNFGLSTPINSTIQGIQVTLTGMETLAGGQLLATLDGVDSKTTTLPLTTGTVILGGPSDEWGSTWTPAQTNLSSFGPTFYVQNPTSSSITFTISQANIQVFYEIVSATQCSVAVLLDEICGNFETLPLAVNDPPQLAPSTTVLSNRFYLSQDAGVPMCRHLQIQLSGGKASTKDELLSLTVRGALEAEQGA